MNVNVCQSLFGMLVVEVQFGLCRACSPSNSPAQPSTHPLAVPFTGFPEELPIVKAGNVARAIRKYLPAGAPPRKQTEEWVPFPFPFPFFFFFRLFGIGVLVMASSLMLLLPLSSSKTGPRLFPRLNARRCEMGMRCLSLSCCADS